MFQQKIKNVILNRISFSLRKCLALNNSILRFKVYEVDNTVVLQVKHSITKQSVRFCIFKIPVNNIQVVVFFRDRNPNTVEYFDRTHSVTEVIECLFYDEIDDSVVKACSFLLTSSKFALTPFSKIQICNQEKDLTENNVLALTVKNVNINTDVTRITFSDHDTDFTFDTSLLYSVIRKPLSGDYFFRNKEKFQTFSPARAKCHFDLMT